MISIFFLFFSNERKRGRESEKGQGEHQGMMLYRVMTVALFLSAHRPRWRRNVTQGGKGGREEMYAMMGRTGKEENLKKKSLQEDDI